MSFAALALRARAANDTARAQINNIPSKSHVIPLFTTAWRMNQLALSTLFCRTSGRFRSAGSGLAYTIQHLHLQVFLLLCGHGLPVFVEDAASTLDLSVLNLCVYNVIQAAQVRFCFLGA